MPEFNGEIAGTLTLDRAQFIRDLDDAKVRADRFSADRINPSVQLDEVAKFKKDLAALSGQLTKLDRKTVTPKVNVDTTKAKTAVNDLTGRLEVLRSTTVKPDVDLSGVASSKVQLALLKEQLDRVGRTRETATVDVKTGRSSSAVGTLLNALVTVAPAAGVATVALGGLALGAGAAFATAGAAVAGLAVGIKGTVTVIQDDQKKIAAAQKKIDAATDPTAKLQAYKAYKALLATIPAAEMQIITQQDRLNGLWAGFIHQVEPSEVKPFTDFVSLARTGLGYLAPLTEGASRALDGLLVSAKRNLGSPVWQDFIGYAQVEGPKAFHTLGLAAGNTLTGIVGTLRAFAPLTDKVETGILHLSQDFARWGAGASQNGSFLQFMQYVETEGPKVGQLLGQLGQTFVTLAKAAGPIGAEEIRIVTQTLALVNAAAKAHPELIQIGLALFTINRAMKLFKVGALVGLLDGVAGKAGAAALALGSLGKAAAAGGAERGIAGVAGALGTAAKAGSGADGVFGKVATKLPGLAKLGSAAGAGFTALGVGGTAAAVGVLAVGGALTYATVKLATATSGADTYYAKMVQQYHATGNNVTGYNALQKALTTAQSRQTQMNAAIETSRRLTIAAGGDTTKLTAAYYKNADGLRSTQAAITKNKAALATLNAGAALVSATFHTNRQGALQLADTLNIDLSKGLQSTTVKTRQAAANLGTIQQQFHVSRSQAIALAQSLGINLTKSLTSSQGKLAALKQELQFTHSPTRQLQADIKTLGNNSATSDQQITAMSNALQVLGGNTLDTAVAQNQLKQQIIGMTLQGHKGTQALNGNTAAALSNRGQVLQTAQAIKQQAQAIYQNAIQQGKGTQAVRIANDFINRNKTALIDQASKTYGSRDAVVALTRSLQPIPTQASKAAAAMESLGARAEKALKGIGDRHITVSATGSWNESDNLTGISRQPGSNNRLGFATGGPVYGPGTGTSDSIPARLSAGEYIVNSKSAAKHRPVLDAINYGTVPGYSTGGPVVDLKATTSLGDMITGANAWLNAHVQAYGKTMAGKFKDQASATVNFNAGAGVKQWTSTILRALAYVHQSPSNLAGYLALTADESGGNPSIANTYDINAQRGYPSTGLTQLIRPTYQAYVPDSMRGIGPFKNGVSLNPFVQYVTSMLYGMARYGSLSNIPGIRSVLNGGPYLPYDQGGLLAPGVTMAINKTGTDEHVLTDKDFKQLEKDVQALLSSSKSSLAGRTIYINAGTSAGNAVDRVAGNQSASAIQAAFTNAAGTFSKLPAGSERRSLWTYLDAQNVKIKAAIADRNRYAAQVTKVNATISGAKQTGVDYGALSNFDTTSVPSFITQFKAKLGTIKAYTANIDVLRKRGFSKGLISQIIAMGVDQGAPFAADLVKSTPAQLRQIDRLQTQLGAVSGGLGSAAGAAQYGVGALGAARQGEAAAMSSITRLGDLTAQGLKSRGNVAGQAYYVPTLTASISGLTAVLAKLFTLDKSKGKLTVAGLRTAVMDGGGVLKPGVTLVHNKLGHDETVLPIPPRQVRSPAGDYPTAEAIGKAVAAALVRMRANAPLVGSVEVHDRGDETAIAARIAGQLTAAIA